MVVTTEKEFYLRSFRHRSMLLSFEDLAAADQCSPVVDELRENGAMVLSACPGFRLKSGAHVLNAATLSGDTERLSALARELVSAGYAAVRPGKTTNRAGRLRHLRDLSIRLGVDKLVVCDDRGGITTARGVRSFMTAGALSRLFQSHDRRTPWTRSELSELLRTVRSGIESVNLTRPADLANELFTYEGSGTLLTAHEYCTVGKLGVNDFREALDLLARGEREGFLLHRSDEEKTNLLLSAYGAWFEHRRLAGLAGLELDAYRAQKVGEIRGLYTITRFKGGGVGRRIIGHMVRVARQRKLKALFACTSSGKAAAFFERNGFVPVDKARVPARKWSGRSAGPHPLAFWRDL